MQSEDIERFVDKHFQEGSLCAKISFQKRNAIFGLFVKDKDYAYLKSKNFWRIVPQSSIQAYNQSGNMGLSRIFNGSEIARLAPYAESFEA
ncbi:MAG TPA: short-chain dehydrogenase [Chitinophagaceae bacterium]|jgi:hypothetical protein|nr:short-chain dehydrogenase [Chitinophagaceae bacterium]